MSGTRGGWRDRIVPARPYALPMLGLTALTTAATLWHVAVGVAAGGVSLLLLEYDRRVRRAAKGEQP